MGLYLTNTDIYFNFIAGLILFPFGGSRWPSLYNGQTLDRARMQVLLKEKENNTLLAHDISTFRLL